MGTSRPLWRGLFLLWLWPATGGDAQGVKQPVLPLFTAEEAEKLRLLDEEWKIVDEIRTRRQALSTRGPLIAVQMNLGQCVRLLLRLLALKFLNPTCRRVAATRTSAGAPC